MNQRGLEKLSRNITKWLNIKKISQSEVARRAGISYVSINNYINCRAEPRVSTIAILARCLGVDVRELLAGIETEDMI